LSRPRQCTSPAVATKERHVVRHALFNGDNHGVIAGCEEALIRNHFSAKACSVRVHGPGRSGPIRRRIDITGIEHVIAFRGFIANARHDSVADLMLGGQVPLQSGRRFKVGPRSRWRRKAVWEIPCCSSAGQAKEEFPVERSPRVGVVALIVVPLLELSISDARVKGLRIVHFVIHSAEGLIVINAEPGANAGAPVTKDIPGQAHPRIEQLPV